MTNLRFARLTRVVEIISKFRLSRTGNVGISFAFALVPIMGFASAMIDYGNLIRNKAVLQSAADAAALAAVNANITKSSSNLTTLQTNAQIAAAAAFRANLNAALTNVATINTVFAASNGLYSARVDATATVQNSLGFITHSNTVGAHASGSSALSAANYINIYVLVDTSQSMGLGADASDQQGMMNTSGIWCSLACHGATGSSDPVTIAHNNNFKLRIDVVRSALQAMITQAQTTAVQTGAVIKIGIYTFDTNFHTISALSNQFLTLASDVTNLDIARYDAGTSIRYGIQQLAALLGSAGNGSTSAAPLTFVMLMTDGVANAVDNTASGWWNPASTAYPAYDGKLCWNQTPPHDSGPWYAPSGAPAATPCVPDPYTTTHLGNGQMEMQPLDPTWCDLIKSHANVKMMTLYTTYVLLPAASTDPTNVVTNDWRDPMLQSYIIPKIQPAMTACASSASMAFQGGDSASISAAVAAMAKAAMNKPPHLVN